MGGKPCIEKSGCDAVLSRETLAKFLRVYEQNSARLTKPDPAMLFGVIDAPGSTPKHALCGGDSEVDQATAINSDVAFAFFTGGYLNADLAHPPPYLFVDVWPAQFDIRRRRP